MAFVGLLSAALSDQDELSIYLCVGVVGGLGMSLLYISAWIAANTYYVTRRQRANSIVVSGSAIGLLVCSPAIHFLLYKYGLSGMYMLMAAYSLNMVVVSLSIPGLKQDFCVGGDNKSSQTKLKDIFSSFKDKCFHSFFPFDLCQNGRYVAFVIVMSLAEPSMLHTLYTYVPDFVITSHFPAKLSWPPVAIMGVSNTLSCLVLAFGENKTVFTVKLMYFCSLVVTVMSQFLLVIPAAQKQYWIVCLSAVLFGLGKSWCYGLRVPFLATVVSEENLDRALGAAETVSMFAMLSCPLLGTLYEMTGNYQATFAASGLSVLLGATVLMLLLLHIHLCGTNTVSTKQIV